MIQEKLEIKWNGYYKTGLIRSVLNQFYNTPNFKKEGTVSKYKSILVYMYIMKQIFLYQQTFQHFSQTQHQPVCRHRFHNGNTLGANFPFMAFMTRPMIYSPQPLQHGA